MHVEYAADTTAIKALTAFSCVSRLTLGGHVFAAIIDTVKIM